MAIASSGQVCFSQLQSEFGGSDPICLSEYYRNGSYVPGTETVSTAANEVYLPLISPYPNDPSNLVGDFAASFTTEFDGSKWQAIVIWAAAPLYAFLVPIGSPEFPASLTFPGQLMWFLSTGFIFNSEPTSFTSRGFIGNGLPETSCTYYRGSRKPEIFPGAETSGGTAARGSFQNAIYIDYEGVRYPSGVTSSSTTNINTGVPTSGQVCLSNFRGAYKP